MPSATKYSSLVRAGLAAASIDARPGLAIGDESGRHVFSDTLAEHQVAVRAYLKRSRERQRQ